MAAEGLFESLMKLVLQLLQWWAASGSPGTAPGGGVPGADAPGGGARGSGPAAGSEDAYELLGVKKGATTASEVNKKFRVLALGCHPDKHPDDPDAERRFKVLNAAKA